MASRVRFSEHVPPLSREEARALGNLATSWEGRVAPSAAPALEERGRRLAAALRARGRGREAAELERAVALLERIEELHDHAFALETLTQLYRALLVLAPSEADETELEESMTWRQSGACDRDAPASSHGPAFRATAALRSRAFRRVESMVARLSRSS